MLLIMAGGTLRDAGSFRCSEINFKRMTHNSKLPININGTGIMIEDAIGSTGLDYKNDPGMPIIYAGFGALILTTCICMSYFSHSQRLCRCQRRTPKIHQHRARYGICKTEQLLLWGVRLTG